MTTLDANFISSIVLLQLFFIMYQKYFFTLIASTLVQTDLDFGALSKANIGLATTLVLWEGSANYSGSGILGFDFPLG